MNVFFSNLGCKLNQAELESLSREFVRVGHRVASHLESADVHVVNTCTVTHAAARDSRKLARRGRRANGNIKTVLTGCWVSEKPADLETSTGADLFIHNSEKADLLEIVEKAFPELAQTQRQGSNEPTAVPCSAPRFGNARALIKIEDGCNMRCSFCIIPTTRGTQESRDPQEVLAELDALQKAGFREAVITGVQISSYRWGSLGLYELTRMLLERSRIDRLRLTSIAPWQFDLRLLDLFANGRLCRHFHLSLQSGADRTLKTMRRPYTTESFRNLAATIRDRVPGVAITTDVIVGFPGETDSDFAESLAFVDEMAFARTHVFPFSTRNGTAAAELPNHVSHARKRERMRRMLAVAEYNKASFLESQLGERLGVLWETRKNDTWFGTTDNYLRVSSGHSGDLTHRIDEVTVLARKGDSVVAELCPTGPPPHSLTNPSPLAVI